MNFRPSLLSSAISLALLFQPVFAYGEEQVSSAGNDEQELEKIIVTGEKLGRSLQETSSSVVIYTGEDLEKKSIQDLYDIVSLTPNVGQSFGEKGFSIRGIDQRLGTGTGLLINTVVDGASLPNNQSTFFGPYSAWDLQQVEILRGPQGTTQGRNAVGGTIILNTANPEMNEFSGKARASVAQLGTTQLAGAVNLPLINDELAMRVAVDKRESDGWVENPTRNEDYDARDFTNAKAKLLWQPHDDFSLLYTLNFTDSKGGEDLVDIASFPEKRINTANEAAEEGSEHLINNIQMDYQLNENWSVTAVSTFYDHDYLRTEDIDQGPTPGPFLNRTQDDKSFSQEVRFLYDNAENIRWLIGGYYGDFENNTVDKFSLPVLFLGVPPQVLAQLGVSPFEPINQARNFKTEEKNKALFTEFEYDLTSQLTAILGARFDDESRDFTGVTSTQGNLPPALLPPDQLRQTQADYNAFLPKFGLRYRQSDTVVWGLSAQKAYRSGGTSVSVVSATTQEYDPEFTWTYEMSVRSSFDDGRYFIDANIFYTDWEDMQLSRLVEGALSPQDTITDNAGASRVYGLELQAGMDISEQWKVQAALGLLDSEFTDYVANAGSPNETVYTGNEFAYAPGMNFAISSDYDFGNGFILRADATWVDDQFSTFENRVGADASCNGRVCNDPITTIEAHWVVNSKFGYEADNWSVYVFARNLFDKDYATQINQVIRNLGTGQPFQTLRSAEPRVAGVELNYNF